MKKLRILFVVICLVTSILFTMTAQEKKFQAPAITGGMPINEVIASRHSTREFDTNRAIDDNTLGQLLWMAVGINRPDAQPGKSGVAANRSNPTALNWQEINAYVFGKDGVWKDQPASNSLVLVKEGDYRSMVAGTKEFTQDFVMEAPYSVVFVADLTNAPEGERTKAMALVDAGIACENFTLACTSLGIATVPRATMDSDAISTLLGLSPRQFPVMNNPIGYAR